nr:hypothetical protein [Candidatus Sigynarchaeota archaeon]
MYERRKEALIQSLQGNGVLHDARIERAILMVPMEEFIPPRLLMEDRIYADTPQVFYFKSQADRRTISAPHMICIMLEYLNLRSNDTLLFLGSKSGYIEAIASLLCTEGHVYVVESSEEVLEFTRSNLQRTGFGENVSLIHGNPLTMAGTESLGMWDKILIPYQVEEADIYPAVRQLNEHGVLFAPIGGDDMQYFTQIIKNEGKYYGTRISSVIFSPLDKNVTFFSQQVQFLELVKKLNKQANVTTNIDTELQNAREALQARRVQAAKDPVNIIYDSEIGDQLHEKYRQETLVSARDESWDFKVFEGTVVELAMQYRGSVRVVTIMNKLNIPFEMVKLYLKKSTQGKLVGDMNDAKSLKFVLNDELVQKDPVTTNILNDLMFHVDNLDGLLKETTLAEFKDMLCYFIDKLEFLERERKMPFRSTTVGVKQMVQQVDMLQAAMDGKGQDWQATRGKLMADLGNGLKDLKAAMQRF